MLGSDDWPPERFLNGLEQCQKFGVLSRLKIPDDLQEIYDSTMFFCRGHTTGAFTLTVFFETLKNLLSTRFANDSRFAALQAARGPAAVADLTSAIYVLMYRYKIAPPLLIG